MASTNILIMLSVVLATYNEEENLARCLDAVKEIVGEIIIVDGSSTDKTRSIAKKYGAKVIKTTNKPIFHINKQMAIDAAKGDLILQLDADEVLDDELQQFVETQHKKLLESKKNKKKFSPQAWWLKRKNYFLGTFLTKGGQYPDPVIRLFLKGKAYLPQKDVHEQMTVNGKTETADGHLLHFANPNFAVYLRKFNTYTSLTASHLKENNIQINVFNFLNFFFKKPVVTFVSLYFRHKGFIDGIPGFTFALMSALHHPIAYLKLWELYRVEEINQQ